MKFNKRIIRVPSCTASLHEYFTKIPMTNVSECNLATLELFIYFFLSFFRHFALSANQQTVFALITPNALLGETIHR